MEADGPGYALTMVSALKTNLESIVVYETSWINAIIQDDVELARQLLGSNENIGSIGLTHVVGKVESQAVIHSYPIRLSNAN